MTELGELAQEVGVSERTLRRAVDEGAIHAQRPTPRQLHVSAAEKAFVRRSWALFSKLKTTLRTEHDVRFVVLFGSGARGDDRAGSDVDLIVSLRDSDMEKVLALELKLEEALGRPADLVALEDAESKPELMSEVASEGRVVVDRDRRWPALQKRRPGLERQASRSQRQRRGQALAGIDRMLGR